MENEKNYMPGYDVYEYLLLINPDKKEYSKVMEVKQQFHAVYKAPSALYSKPHITLVNFIQAQMFESLIIKHLNNVAETVSSFPVVLKDYGSFFPHTIFINVMSKDPIVNLVKRLREKLQVAMTFNKEYPPHFITNPHLTIARRLERWQYEQGVLEYSSSHFSGMFMAEEMLLLRKPADGEKAKYELVKKFSFNGFWRPPTQGDLFSSL